MKRVLFLLMGLFCVSSLFAQNVGIGTTTPNAKLDVKAASSYVAQFNGSAPMYMGIFESDIYRGYWGSYSGAAEDVDFGTGSGNATGKMHLTIQAIPKVTINSSGLVGIGTTNPNHLLHVNGGDMFVQSGSGAIRYGFDGGNQWKLFTPVGASDLKFGTTPDGTTFTTRHWFTQTGNVGFGVGDVVPIARLQVKGAGNSNSTNTFSLHNSNGDTLLRMRDDGRMGIGYNSTVYGRTVNLGGTGINLYTANEGAFGGAVFPTDTSLVLWSNSDPDNYLVFQPSWGNTGIGTYTPNAKLHLNGAMLIGSNTQRIATGFELSVDGEIICENLVMQSSGSWPDYVFENNYRLMPIAELEKSIRKNKHLPNVPSAATIEKKGVNMGEISKALLEKVEELTLYVIQLKKENTELENRIKKLEEKHSQ